MAIEFIGSATGITSATLPSHQADDLIIGFAFRDGSTTRPTLPADWTPIRDDPGTTCSARIAYRIATNNTTTTGTWTNATSVIFLVYRGAFSSPIGNASFLSGSGTSVTYDAVTVDKNSWAIGFAAHRSANVDLVAPDGMTNRAYVQDATDEAAAHDTNSNITAWTSKTTSVGGTASGWISYTLEIKNLINATANAESVQAESFVFLYPITPEWHAWFFEDRVLTAEAEANYLLDGQDLLSQIAEISAEGESSAIVSIEGIELNTNAEETDATGTANFVLTGENLTLDQNEIIVSGFSTIELSGQESEIVVSNVSATTDNSATVNLNGVGLNSNPGNVTASATGGETQMVPGNISYQLPKLSAITRIDGLEARSEIANLVASGTIIINNRAKIYSIEAKLEAQKVGADGILDINEDELLLLLAA